MTFVGKILVILIMAFSLVFLGVSTVVFTTATNWKAKADTQKTEITKLQGRLNDLDARVKDAQGKLDTARQEHSKVIGERENRIKELDKQVADATAEMVQARSQLEVAQKNAQVALAEATARKGEIDTLAETLSKAQNQANQFNTQNIDLTDRIRILEREKATAEQNARDLRNTTAKVLAFMKDKGISMENLDRFDPNSVPPEVEGRVNQVNATNRSLELSIGSNDGLAVGQQLYLYRTQPRPEYLGKVKIVSVYPNRSVAEVIGRTVGGKKIQEGDNVSSTFNAR